MSAVSPGPGRPVAESIRLQLGTDALVLIMPGRHSCAVVVSSVLGYPSRLTDARPNLTVSLSAMARAWPTLSTRPRGRSGCPSR
jgi:hypothetical protein